MGAHCVRLNDSDKLRSRDVVRVLTLTEMIKSPRIMPGVSEEKSEIARQRSHQKCATLAHVVDKSQQPSKR